MRSALRSGHLPANWGESPACKPEVAAPVEIDLIRVKNVSKSFGESGAGGVLALENVDCTIAKGSFVSVVGPSGCGKTTLLRLVAGLMHATHGTISMDGQAITGTRRDVGVVFQSSILLPWRTVIENVLLPAEILGLDMAASRERAQDLLRLVKLEGFEDKMPRQLSGGMQQRASIARALLHDPKVLLMDEPFGALDAMTREQMNLELQRIWMESGKTVILITHSIPEAIFLGDRVFVMTPRPGTLKRVIDVDLPRPRSMAAMGAPGFVRVSEEIREIFSHSGSFE
jgi:NitT/TauT family transport system ATP-binding protein